MERQSRAWSVKPASAAWWLRVVTVLLLVFHITYVRYHLLAETHLDVLHAGVAESNAHDDGPDDGGHHDSDHHKPHSASDHLIQMVAKHPPSFLAAPFLASETLVCLTQRDAQVVCLRRKRWTLPGESPPDPAQPRAPPLV